MEILRRGPDALRAYRKALEQGKTHDRRVPVMIVGQDRSGKTSLKKSLKGEKFDPDEDSTDGIDVDPTLFRPTTDVLRAKKSGETLEDAEPKLSKKISDALAREMRRHLKGENSDSFEEKSEPWDASAGAELDAGIQHAGTALLETNSANVSSSRLAGLDATKLVSKPASDRTSNALATNLERVIDSVPEEIMRLALNQEDNEKPEDDMEFILWDFAGQSVFYTTHGLFLSRIAIYILTHDLSLKLQDRAVALVRRDMYKRKIEDKSEMTNLDYIHWWLSSIHSYSRHPESPSPDSEHLPANLPPVFLAGTHADKCCSPRDVTVDIFPDLEGKVYEKHVMTKVFAVDNTQSGSEREDCGIKELRAAVIQAGRELPDMKKLFPVKYVTPVWISWFSLARSHSSKLYSIPVNLLTIEFVRSRVEMVMCEYWYMWVYLDISKERVLCALSLSLPKVINIKFLLQPHQWYNITKYGELGFSLLTRMKDDYNVLILTGRMYFWNLGVKVFNKRDAPTPLYIWAKGMSKMDKTSHDDYQNGIQPPLCLFSKLALFAICRISQIAS